MAFAVHLLLVEDEPLLLMDIEGYLEEAGFDVVSCVTGTSALAALGDNQQTYCALVTDIRLGAGPSGWEVARCARECSPAIPIVYMSGDSGPDWVTEGVPHSIMLGKPFLTKQLLMALAQLLNRDKSPLLG